MKYITVYFIIIFIILSCEKEPEKKIVPVNEELISYFGAYDVGSYWLFEEKNSGKIDSATITNYSKTKSYDMCSDDNTYPETIILTFDSKYTESIYTIIAPNCEGTKSRVTFYFSQGKISVDINEGKDSLYNTGVFGELTYHDTMNINNQNFYNVYEFNKAGNYYDKLFFAKNIGIIRKVTSTEDWILKNYHIKKP